MSEIQLVPGVRLKVSNFVRVRKDCDVYRLVLDYISDQPEKNHLIKHYYVWLTDVFTEDYLKTSNRHLTEDDYNNVALTLAKDRFVNCGNEVPPEEGLDASSERGVNRVADAKNFIHPVEESE